MSDRAGSRSKSLLVSRRGLSAHGWVGIVLILIFWTLNWGLSGPRTHWAFFPLWLGYCLFIDALVLLRKGTSLLTRNWRAYIGLFSLSALVWWLFEAINWRLGNWYYEGAETFTRFEFWAFATLNFTTVIPAIFGSAELVSTFAWVRRMKRGPVIPADRKTTGLFFLSGVVMFALMWAWPRIFFPFIWLSLYFILEPVNVWLGYRSLADWVKKGDWRPVVALWVGVLLTAFFWEMWNYFSYPRWIYIIPWGGGFHLFEMPLLGYGGYLPFALELYAIYHFVMGIFGQPGSEYVRVTPEEA